MRTGFTQKLQAAQQTVGTDRALLIIPRLTRMPLPMQRYDDPFLPFSKAVIDAAHGLVCALVFDFAAYMAPGAAGAVALERAIAYAGSELPTILHGPFASPDYAAMAGEQALNVDAVTITAPQLLPAYLERSPGMAFVLNDLQESYTYDPAAALFSLRAGGGQLQIRLAGESVLYAGLGENFVDALKNALRTF